MNNRQVILGANGIIGRELAKSLRASHTDDIRLVARNPRHVCGEEELFKADLTKVHEVIACTADCSIAFLTVGLPYENEVWLRDWPVILRNVVEAVKFNKCKLVYFDNTYCYFQELSVQTEDSKIAPSGPKGQAKKAALDIVLQAMESGEIEAMVCRAPEFYGPDDTQGITNTMIIDKIVAGKPALVFMSDKVKRTLIYTPDASRATALLGNSPDAFGQTWHLPCDDNRLNYREFAEVIGRTLGTNVKTTVLLGWLLKALAKFNPTLFEVSELFPRYAVDNIFESSKFKHRFPNFRVTSYAEGISYILKSSNRT